MKNDILFNEQVIEDIRSRIDLMEYYIQKRGLNGGRKSSRELRPLCPFHADKKSGSFVVTKDCYVCYACGAKGDVFSLVQNLDGLSFPETVKELADYAGVVLPTRTEKYKAPPTVRISSQVMDYLGISERKYISELFSKDRKGFLFVMSRTAAAVGEKYAAAANAARENGLPKEICEVLDDRVQEIHKFIEELPKIAGAKSGTVLRFSDRVH